MAAKPPVPSDGKAQLDQAWAVAYEQAEKKFGEITKKYLKDFKDKDGKMLLRKEMKAENLIAQVQGGKDAMVSTREGHQKWTSILKKAMIPIETIGGLAAGITATVLPGTPSGLAYNALSYLIGVGHEVSASYDALADLFEQITQFISRFEVLAKQEISPELLGTIHQVLISLILICALSVRLLKRKLAGSFISAFFLGQDDKIQEQLSTLEKLSKFQDSMVGVLTLERVIGISRSIEVMYNDLPEIREGIQGIRDENRGIREDTKGMKSHMKGMEGHMEVAGEGVRELLSMDKTREQSARFQAQVKRMKDLIDPKTSNVVRELYNGFSRELVSETGRWIREEGLFNAWIKQEIPILAIHGESGTGKSYLATSVIQYLSDIYPQGVQHTSRVSVVYHFCRKHNRDLQLLKQALRGMAYDIAQNDPVFANFFEGECRSKEDLATAHQVWDKLFVGFFCEKEFENRAYIVLDGLDQALASEREFIVKLFKDYQLSKARGRKIRVQVLVIERESLEQPLRDILGFEVPVIKVDSAKNAGDIRRYVTKFVDENRRWHGVRGLREEIIDSVTKNAQGTFYLADYKLKDLKEKRRAEDIRAALKTNPKNLPDAIRSDLQRLGESLEKWEIDELNHLLAWVVVGKQSFSLSDIEIISDLRGAGANESLASLETQIRTRYGPLFNVVREDGRTTEDLQISQPAMSERADGDGTSSDHDVYSSFVLQAAGSDADIMDFHSNSLTTFVELANASIGDYFQDQKEHNVSDTANRVEEAEIKIIQRFLKLVCDEKLMERLGIDEFLKQKLQDKPVLINLNMRQAKVMVLEGCLSLIIEDHLWQKYDLDEKRQMLAYAVKWFPEHMYAIDYNITATLGIADKERIGRSLLALFRDGEVIRRWAKDNSWLDIHYLSWGAPKVRHILDWLGDPVVADLFKPEDTTWIKDLLSDEPKSHLLRPTVDIIASEWLQGVKWNAMSSYFNVRAYLTEIEMERNKDYVSPDTGHENGSTTAQILETAKWTGFEENSRFHERVASTILAFWEVDDATKYYQKAIEIDANNWQAHAGLAKSYDERGKWELAIESMDMALKQFEDDPLVKWDFKKDYDDFTYLLARWHEKCGRNEKALELFRSVHNSDKIDFEAAFRILKILTAEEKYGGIIEFLEDMKSEDHTIQSDMTRLDDCHFEYFEEDEFHEMTVLAARKTGNLTVLQKAYIRAIKAADVRSKAIVSGCLRHWYGRLLLHELRGQEQAATVFEDVMKMTASSSSDGALGWARFQSGKRLAMIYIDRARKAGPSTLEAKTNIQKIAQLSVGRTSDDDDEARMNMMTNTTSTINITLVLGRWYAREEKNDKEAREHFVSHIRLGIDLLSDSNPYNDPDAYKKLAYAFMHYGDDVNARAAWSLLGPVEPPSMTPSPPLSASEPSVHSGVGGEKDGDPEAFLSAVEEEQSGLTITENTIEDLENGEIKVLKVTTDVSIKESVVPAPSATTQTAQVLDVEMTPKLKTKGDLSGSFPPELPANDEEVAFMTPIEPSRETTEVFPQPPQSRQISNDKNPQMPLEINTHNEVSTVDKDIPGGPTLEEPRKDDPEALSPHDSAPPPPASPSTPLDPNDFSLVSGNLDLGCDGRCGKGWSIADDIHLCRICIDTGFCGDCLQKCKNGTLGFSMCNPKHEWFHVPKANSWLPVGMVRVGGVDGVDGVEGGELMGIEEWKEGIRRDWGL